ncbi:MAG: hypothetical protein HQK89_04315 [Nitrospirae bacterium]|nr:hypothetical protein [Nitrospirota bacterium]
MGRRDSITLIYYSDRSGRSRNLKLPAWLFRSIIVLSFLFFTVSVFTAYVAVTLYKDYKGHKSYRERVMQDFTISALKPAAGDTKRESGNFKTTGSVANTKTAMLASGHTNEGEAKTALTPGGSPQPTVPVLPGSGGFISSSVNTGVVNIENIRYTEHPKKQNVSLVFELVKSGNRYSKLSGYVFVVWRDGSRFLSVPDGADIQNGQPLRYKDGESFDIRFKKRFTRIINNPLSKINDLYVLVYNAGGDIILKNNVTLK